MGSVIAGWDGWRGSIYRLAVEPEHRRLGSGSRCSVPPRSAWRRSAHALHAIVVEANASAVAFWDATDWEHQAGQLRFAKGLGE